eukprot:4152314-Heterocapsa_arctica.AAC.1
MPSNSAGVTGRPRPRQPRLDCCRGSSSLPRRDAAAAAHHGKGAARHAGLHFRQVALVCPALLDVLDQRRVLVEVE